MLFRSFDSAFAKAQTSGLAAAIVVEPLPDFPKAFTSLDSLAKENPKAVEAAFAKARALGIPEGTFLKGAVFDFLVTGDEAFLKGAQQAATLVRQNPLDGLVANPLVVAAAAAAPALAPLGSIEGSKWNDGNANGIWDAGETGLAGWTIFIDSVANGTLDPWELSTVTDANGKYKFADLGPGQYAVREVNQVGWIQTSPTAPYDLVLGLADACTDINFGNYELPALNLNPRSQTIVEGLVSSQSASYAVTLSKASTETITVNYATSAGSATAGSD